MISLTSMGRQRVARVSLATMLVGLVPTPESISVGFFGDKTTHITRKHHFSMTEDAKVVDRTIGLYPRVPKASNGGLDALLQS